MANTNAIDNTIKLCPFCGGEPSTEDLETNRTCYYWVYCMDCTAETRRCINREEAIEAWNRRVDT